MDTSSRGTQSPKHHLRPVTSREGLLQAGHRLRLSSSSCLFTLWPHDPGNISHIYKFKVLANHHVICISQSERSQTIWPSWRHVEHFRRSQDRRQGQTTGTDGKYRCRDVIGDIETCDVISWDLYDHFFTNLFLDLTTTQRTSILSFKFPSECRAYVCGSRAEPFEPFLFESIQDGDNLF